MLIAVGIGVPLYSNAAGVMPLVQALHDKGLPMGTLLAFMMDVAALSLPEAILLWRVLKPPLIAAFVAVTATGIVAVGYLFNAVIPSRFHPEASITMMIKILGPCCTNCVNLERVAREAVTELSLDAQIEKVTDFPTTVG